MGTHFLFGVKKSAYRYLVLPLLLLIGKISMGQDTINVGIAHIQAFDAEYIMPQFNFTSRVRVYLPDGYNKKNSRYPVLYLQDGQNILNASDPHADLFHAGRELDSLIGISKKYCIVAELTTVRENNVKDDSALNNPVWLQSLRNAELNNYVTFLAESVKPFIDDHYMTLSQKENTIIAGADTGALVAYFAMLQYPAIFGKAGIFSPVLSAIPDIVAQTDSLAAKVSGKFFFYSDLIKPGDDDSLLTTVTNLLGSNSGSMIYVITENAEKNGQGRGKWLSEFYKWIRAEGFNYVIDLKN